MEDDWDCGSILADAFGRAPDLRLGDVAGGVNLGCWRRIRGPVDLPALPRAAIIASLSPLAGASRGGGDNALSRTVQVVGSGEATKTSLSQASCDLVLLTASSTEPTLETQMRGALADALGSALLRQILLEVGAGRSLVQDLGDRVPYVETLLRAFAAHVARAAFAARETKLPVSASSAFRLHQVLDALRRRPGDPHTVEEMAASVGLTPEHFSKVFKSAMGVPPRQYLLKLRVEEAIRLMTNPQLSLTQISEALGFASQSHFTRVFRSQTGEAPSAYRRLASQALH